MNLTPDITNRIMMPPPKTLKSTDLPAPVNNIINMPELCRCIELKSDQASGLVVEVHPISNDAGKWYEMPVEPGPSGRNTCIFDKIRTTGTTADLTKCTFFPLI